MNYLVTGGAGFIGSGLVKKLLDQDHKVIIIDDFSLGKEKNLAPLKNNENLIIYKKNICDDVSDIFEKEKINAVFHFAALPRVQFSIQKPIATHNVNVNGTLNLLQTCKKLGIKRFVFSSSSSIYGDQDTSPQVETMTPNPMSPYALHKLIGEHYCKLFNLLYGLETICLRYFNVFGPGQDPEGDYACLIPKFIKLINQDIQPTINGDGKQTRDFIFVDDVVEVNILAVNTDNQACFGQTFNIGAGKNYSVNEVTKGIINITNKKIEPTHGPAVIEPKHTLADITKAKNLLGWSPKTSFEQGLERTCEYFVHR